MLHVITKLLRFPNIECHTGKFLLSTPMWAKRNYEKSIFLNNHFDKFAHQYKTLNYQSDIFNVAFASLCLNGALQKCVCQNESNTYRQVMHINCSIILFLQLPKRRLQTSRFFLVTHTRSILRYMRVRVRWKLRW